MTTTITEMKQTLIQNGCSEELLKSLSEKQVEIRYQQLCKNLTAAISNNGNKEQYNSSSVTNANTVQIPNSSSQQEYEKALEKYKNNIDNLLSKGDYLGAIKEFLMNSPENPNLITGEAPCPAFGEIGVVKQLVGLLKNPKKILELVKTAKKYVVKSFKELLNVAKSLLVQSKPCGTLPKWVGFGRSSGSALDIAVEALRFGNDNAVKIPTKILLNAIKNLERSGIKNVNPKDIKIVRMYFGHGNGEAIYFSYFNPKTGESILLNAEGHLYGTVQYSYTKTGKLLDACITPVGGVGENVSTRLLRGAQGLQRHGWSRFIETYGEAAIEPIAKNGMVIKLGHPPIKYK